MRSLVKNLLMVFCLFGWSPGLFAKVPVVGLLNGIRYDKSFMQAPRMYVDKHLKDYLYFGFPDLAKEGRFDYKILFFFTDSSFKEDFVRDHAKEDLPVLSKMAEHVVWVHMSDKDFSGKNGEYEVDPKNKYFKQKDGKILKIYFKGKFEVEKRLNDLPQNLDSIELLRSYIRKWYPSDVKISDKDKLNDLKVKREKMERLMEDIQLEIVAITDKINELELKLKKK